MVVWLLDSRLPDPELEADADGLVALGGSLEPEFLLAAYRAGIFPWSSEPVLNWWSPDPRAVFDLAPRPAARSVRQSARRGRWTFTIDRAFEDVIAGCRAPAPGREETWISDDFVAAYRALFARGAAHSVEVWEAGELVGGLYGVAQGGFFGGESMFRLRTDASKAALAYLLDRLRVGGFALCDAQSPTEHLTSLGVQCLQRRAYLDALATALARTEAKLVEGPAPSLGWTPA
ncbi:MAG: leucyl/phenylalanyl-tRNA--protein transferase [Planctomycetes bacterium]|nr:leucyl/phenylalanyl-tRNA--protein transferase [Planctomycetota bacterium]